eukprot:3462036-Pleurochrysis_carterae.AAC.1
MGPSAAQDAKPFRPAKAPRRCASGSHIHYCWPYMKYTSRLRLNLWRAASCYAYKLQGPESAAAQLGHLVEARCGPLARHMRLLRYYHD